VSKSHLRILKSLVNLPTAPFVETHVINYIEDFVARRKALRMTRDPFGNLHVRYQPPRKTRRRIRPVLFAAHMDHPGFVAEQMIDDHHVRAAFRGWVRASYFKNEKIRFHSAGRWVPATIEKIIPHKPKSPGARRAASSARSFGADAPPAAVIARIKSPVEKNSPGMWALPDAAIRGNVLRARMCDDIAGLAAILCMLDAVCRRRSNVPCDAFFTRAEEVGFAGALAAVADKTVPRRAVVVAVECSKAIPGVAMGGGPVLRVGDKASIFTPAATTYCQVVADDLAASDKTFQYQRKLMDGGTCESTAYCHYGYDATGICLPLGNYHNMDEKKRRIGPEYIDTRDYINMVRWFIALAESPGAIPYDGAHPGLDQRLKALLEQHRTHLKKTAQT